MRSYHIDCHVFLFSLANYFFHFLKPKEMLFFIVTLVQKIEAYVSFSLYAHFSSFSLIKSGVCICVVFCGVHY